MSEWYTIQEAAEIYSVSESTIRRWIKKYELRTRWDFHARRLFVLIRDLEEIAK